MGTINDKLDKLNQTKTNIKNELRGKGADVKDSDTFASYEGYLHDLEILNAQAKTVNPSTSSQTVIPDSEYNALSQVTVNAIQTETKNVKSATTSQIVTPTAGKFINEITVEPIELEQITVTPSITQQIITPSQNKDGISQVTASPVTSAIDENIVSGNIKANSTILGVQGKSSVVDTETATATAGDIVLGKTAYVNGQKIEGTNDNPDWTEIGYTGTPQYIIDGFEYAKEIKDNWDNSITTATNMYQYNRVLKYFPLVDTSNLQLANQMFMGDYNLNYIELINTSNLTNAYRMFYGCTILEEIPPLNLSNVTNFTQFVNGCARLKKIPIFNLVKVKDLYQPFTGCGLLTTESLNNIMASLLTATAYTGTKTLAYIGLSSAQATTCQTLSNWTALSNAGWTTGY